MVQSGRVRLRQVGVCHHLEGLGRLSVGFGRKAAAQSPYVSGGGATREAVTAPRSPLFLTRAMSGHRRRRWELNGNSADARDSSGDGWLRGDQGVMVKA